jgi:hypothetical protein
VQIEEVRHLLALQCGVIARRQVLEAGGTDNDIQRLIRRRQWARVHEGVYVDHTGPLSPIQRDWAAVLYAWPAALAGRDALRAHGVRGFEAAVGGVVDVVVPASRRVTSQPGVRVRRLATFETDVQANLSPPRVRLEPAVLEVAASAPGVDAAVGVLSDVCQARRTTCPRLLVALDGRERSGIADRTAPFHEEEDPQHRMLAILRVDLAERGARSRSPPCGRAGLPR